MSDLKIMLKNGKIVPAKLHTNPDGSTVCVPDHPTIIIGENVTLADNITYSLELVIGDNNKIGSKVKLGTKVILCANITIGEGTSIGDDTTIMAESEIGNNVIIGAPLEGEEGELNELLNSQKSEKAKVYLKHMPSGHLTFGFDVTIEDDVRISYGVHLTSKVFVGKGARIGASTSIGRSNYRIESGIIVPKDTKIYLNP